MRCITMLMVTWCACGSPAPGEPEPPPAARAPTAELQPGPDGPPPQEPDPPAAAPMLTKRTASPGSAGPMATQVAMLKVYHPRFRARELYIDGRYRGQLPVDVVLPFGAHTFEVQIGPGDRLVLEAEIEPSLQGVRKFDLEALEAPGAVE